MDLVSCCIYIILVFTSFSYFKVPSTCQQNTYDSCQDVQKQKLVQVCTNSSSNFNQTCALFHLSIVFPKFILDPHTGALHWLPERAAAAMYKGAAKTNSSASFEFEYILWLNDICISIENSSCFCNSRFLNNSANRSPTPHHSRFAKTSTARSLREWAGQCQRRRAEEVETALPLFLRGRLVVAVEEGTGRAQRATSWCSLEPSATPTPTWRPPPRPRQAGMPSTLVEIVLDLLVFMEI